MMIRQRQILTQEQRLTLRQEERQRLFHLQMDLVGRLRDETYRPQAQCPKCFHQLTTVEILTGFTRDPRDITTQCPQCLTRFTAKLICRGNYGSIEVSFYCPEQTLDQIKGLHQISPNGLKREHPNIFRSAMTHFGSLTATFAKLGIAYTFSETEADWKSKVVPFLGQMSDGQVARCVDVSRSTIRRMRLNHNIEAYNPHPY